MSDVRAEVAVKVTRYVPHQVLTYRVPPGLQGTVAAGMLVWVPLRAERVQGIVVRVYEGDAPPDFALRPISGIGDPEVVIPAHNLQLALWLAERYCGGIWEALALLLPPGVQRESSPTWFATERGQTIELGGLPTAERGVLFYLRQHGERDEAAVLATLHGAPALLRRALASLHDDGLIERGSTLSRRQARPLYEPTATLHLPPDFDGTALARAPQQRAALDLLAARGDGVISAQGVAPATLRALASKGLITLGQRELLRNPLDGAPVARDTPPELTALQSSGAGAGGRRAGGGQRRRVPGPRGHRQR